MLRIQQKIENMVEKDKLMHFCVGLLLAQLAYICAWLLILPLVVGLSKELYDKYISKTEFNRWDLLATCLGCTPVIAINILMNL